MNIGRHSVTKSDFRKKLKRELIEEYGILIRANDLYHLLGFASKASFRQGLIRGTVVVPIITFENRRGKFALADDVAHWLTENRFKSLEKK